MNISSVLLIIVIILVTQISNNAQVEAFVTSPASSTGSNSRDCFNEAKQLLFSSNGLLGVATDTTKAAASTVNFCLVKCIKIFEDAGKAFVKLNFLEVAKQGVEFGVCFLECVKVAAGAVTTSVGSAGRFTQNLLGATLFKL